MNTKKDHGNCANCGKPLEAYQKKFCCRACTGRHRLSNLPLLHKICKECGNGFDTKSEKRQFCCTACSDKGKITRTKDDYNRPYTRETKYLILLWFKQGWDKVEIAQILGRSLESVEKAFV